MSVFDVTPLVAAYRDRSANYGRPDVPLSNHLPMAAAALAAMGASRERVAAWADTYDRHSALRPADADESACRARWRGRLTQQGIEPVLRTAIQEYGAGLGAAAFHAVIRTAYALARDDIDDLASALASWERETLVLPCEGTARRVDAAQALRVLHSAPIDRASPGTPLIATDMLAVARRAGFAVIAASVPAVDAIDGLLIAAATAFADTANFTALHVMTGTAAFRAIARRLGDVDAVMPAFWSAYCAATLAAGPAGSPTARPADVAGLPSWDELLARAVAHDDDHVIKATYTAWISDGERPHPAFRRAAAHYQAKRGAS